MTKQERAKRIVKVTIEAVAAAILIGVCIAIAVARVAAHDPLGAVLATLTAGLATWLLNRIVGALYAEIGVG